MEVKRTERTFKAWIFFSAGLIGTGIFLCELGLHYSGTGPCTGLLVSVLCILYGLYEPELMNQAEKWKNSGKKGVLNMIKVILILILSVFIGISGLILFGKPKKPENETTVIIPGCGVDHDGTVSRMIRGRIDAVLPYLYDHPDAKIIASGGIQDKELPTEAESIRNDLIEHGISPERIYVEGCSSTTDENFANSAKIIAEHDLSRNVLISSDGFHLYRCGKLAEKYGLTPSSVSARTPWAVLPGYWIREVFVILYTWMNRGFSH